jgi:hypothetical protein
LSRKEFAAFLRQLVASNPEKRLLVIHERAGHHYGAPVDAMVWDAKGRLTLRVQPAHSPELNPEERTWKWMRRVVTHNHWLGSLSGQVAAIRDFFTYLTGVKAQVQQLCGSKTPESLVALL